jgi:hypothetical protein
MMNGVWGSGRGAKNDDEQCENFGNNICLKETNTQEEVATLWEGGLTKHFQPSNKRTWR